MSFKHERIILMSTSLFKKEEHEELVHLDNNHRVKAIFQDIEYYKRGKLSGDNLDKYLKLLEVYNSGISLTKQQTIDLHILLSFF
jgi:hypothetical protein